jgi:hypothetical protein
MNTQGLTLKPIGPAVREMLKQEAQDIINKLEIYDVPEDEERQQKIVDYAIQLKIKNMHWPNSKVSRKTAEYFNIPKCKIIY